MGAGLRVVWMAAALAVVGLVEPAMAGDPSCEVLDRLNKAYVANDSLRALAAGPAIHEVDPIGVLACTASVYSTLGTVYHALGERAKDPSQAAAAFSMASFYNRAFADADACRRGRCDDSRKLWRTDVGFPPLPWGLVNLFWTLPATTSFRGISLDVTIDGTLPADAHLYIAPFGGGSLGGIPFYAGLQAGAPGKDGQPVPRLGLFSRWHTRDITAARPEHGGYALESGAEGDFVSVRKPQNWGHGTWTVALSAAGQEQVGGQPATWIEMTVQGPGESHPSRVGALRFEGANLALGGELDTFIEVFGSARIAPSAIPELTVTFSNLKIDGVAVPPLPVRAEYELALPQGARSSWQGPGVVAVHTGPGLFRVPMITTLGGRQTEMLGK